jgi:cell division septum initiation protein DivIVA
MENIIKKIEQFQDENKEKWIELMELDNEAIQFPMARLIGAMTSQLEIIKNELKNGK